VKAVTRAAIGAGTAPLSVDLRSGEMRLPMDADITAISRAIERAGFGVGA
jgi:copper chaperone